LLLSVLHLYLLSFLLLSSFSFLGVFIFSGRKVLGFWQRSLDAA
jgi:hypothetical protein